MIRLLKALFWSAVAAFFALVAYAAIVVALASAGGCASLGKAAQALAPYVPDAISAAERFMARRHETPPPGSCEAIPADLIEGAPAAVAVCSPGSGWLQEAARVLSEAADNDGERLDIAAAGCFPSEAGPDIVCVAPYAP